MSTEKLDIDSLNLEIKDNPNIYTNVVVIGLGATGSSFMLLLAHFLKYVVRYTIHIFDFDYVSRPNRRVSMYGFYNDLGIDTPMGSKVNSSMRILKRLLGGLSFRREKLHNLHAYEIRVDEGILNSHFRGTNIDYIFVFTDNNESRHEVSQYHIKHPNTIVFDCRIGSYDQFEIYYSNNPSKYAKTIYYEEDKTTPRAIDNNTNVCLDDRMNFSIAMASSSLLMNLFVKHLRDEIKEDFKHIMIGNDYLGEVKGYE